MASIYQRKNGKGSPWYVKYRDHRGRQVQRKLATDKAASRQMAAQIETDVARRKLGHVDEHAERFAAEAKRPLGEHIADFQTYLRSKGNTEKHVSRTIQGVIDAARECRWSCMSDIAPESLDEYRERLMAGGLSAKAMNHRVRACKSFTRRLMLWRRIPYDPLVGVELLNVEADRRVVRGAFTDDELARLFEAARKSDSVTTDKPYRQGGELRQGSRTVTIRRRDLLYALAVGTGLRLNEIRHLSVADFNLNGDPPTVRVEARHSKRRREDTQPIRRDLADELRRFLSRLLPSVKPWGDLPRNMAPTIRADCEAAGIPETTDTGGARDFHSLRHTFVTRLARSGVPLRTTQLLARHSDPSLTARVYSHLGLVDTAGALESLPEIVRTTKQEARR